jgi:hypothetical protein
VGAWEPPCRGIGIAKILKELHRFIMVDMLSAPNTPKNLGRLVRAGA